MASFDEFPLSTRLFLKTYRWRRISPTPWTTMSKPLGESRVALISSAGFVLRSDVPFDETIRGGDWSLRSIPSDAELSAVINTHRSELFDPAGIEADPNVALPIDRMRELVREGTIGSFSRRVISLMGSITATGRMMRETAPKVAEMLKEDGADAALLVPL